MVAVSLIYINTLPGTCTRPVKSRVGRNTASWRAPARTRTVGGDAKYFSGDSPRSVIATLRSGTIRNVARSLVHRHVSPVLLLYSDSCHPWPYPNMTVCSG